jgi:metal-responsive CopG/Arc/MetJ family transcriptional regulator
MNMAKNQLATMSILINGREKLANLVQAILTRHSHLVTARMGVNVQPKCVSDCLGLIMIVVQGDKKEIETLEQEIKRVKGVDVKVSVMAKE